MVGAQRKMCTKKIYEFKTILERSSNKEILSWIGLIIFVKIFTLFACILSLTGVFFFLFFSCEIRFPTRICTYSSDNFVISLVFLRFTVAREAASSVLFTLFARMFVAFSFYKCYISSPYKHTRTQHTHTHRDTECILRYNMLLPWDF